MMKSTNINIGYIVNIGNTAGGGGVIAIIGKGIAATPCGQGV